jgi:hypothetical protein
MKGFQHLSLTCYKYSEIHINDITLDNLKHILTYSILNSTVLHELEHFNYLTSISSNYHLWTIRIPFPEIGEKADIGQTRWKVDAFKAECFKNIINTNTKTSGL